MSQRVVLDLGRGDFNSGFSAVTAQVWNDRNPYPMKFVGSLPAAPEISQLHRSWQLLYRALNHRLDWSSRIEIDAADVTNVSQVEFGEICRQLADQINCWLNSESFRSIDQPLRTQLNAADEIRVLIETSDRQLQQLPWHLWSFFEHYPQAEIALSDLEYQRSRSTPSLNNNDKVRILAIFGDSENIDLSQDRAFLEQSENSTIDFLIEPSRKQLYDRLWQGCDVLFFAGHSSSQGQGEIRLNPVDNLTLAQLKYGLRRAISQGLKLVIFNSCDGLGLAQQLAELHIPQVIVMREPVPDKVAHTFLNYFLVSFFAERRSLYVAVREARERLQGLEQEYPCASWLPVIYQNPAVDLTTWQEWGSGGDGGVGGIREMKGWGDKEKIQNTLREGQSPTKFKIQNSSLALFNQSKIQNLKSKIATVLLSSLVATGLVLGARSLGVLQPWELKAYDQLMRSRPEEQQDSRLLIVTITEADLQLPEQRNRKGSLSDQALEQLLNKLEPDQPRAIGLDIYRDFPVGAGQRTLAQLIRNGTRFFAICKGRDRDLNHPGIAPPPELPSERQGFSDVVTDPDRVLRRHLIAMKPDPTSPCVAPYALSAQLAFHYLEAEGITAQYTPNQELQVGNVVFKRLHNHRGGYQAADTWGYQTLLNYRLHRSPLEIAPTVTLTDVLRGSLQPKDVRDRIVLIGVTAQSFHDYLLTPYRSEQGTDQEVPGVIAQAQW